MRAEGRACQSPSVTPQHGTAGAKRVLFTKHLGLHMGWCNHIPSAPRHTPPGPRECHGLAFGVSERAPPLVWNVLYRLANSSCSWTSPLKKLPQTPDTFTYSPGSHCTLCIYVLIVTENAENGNRSKEKIYVSYP